MPREIARPEHRNHLNPSMQELKLKQIGGGATLEIAVKF